MDLTGYRHNPTTRPTGALLLELLLLELLLLGLLSLELFIMVYLFVRRPSSLKPSSSVTNGRSAAAPLDRGWTLPLQHPRDKRLDYTKDSINDQAQQIPAQIGISAPASPECLKDSTILISICIRQIPHKRGGPTIQKGREFING